MFEYNTKGTCSQKISFEVQEGKVRNCSFDRGCPGNLIGISQLVEGMDIDEVIKRFKGIQCGTNPTSCPDQLSRALIQWKELNRSAH